MKIIFNKNLFSRIEETKKLVLEINKKLPELTDVYIFGCFINTQAMIYFGLNTSYIRYLLDNDERKQDKYYYGCELICKSPCILKDTENPLVICHMGEYTKEIKNQLFEINPNINFL